MGFVRCLDDTNTEKGIVVKEMIKKVREDRSGFTLAELLIVVAIVAVLVAIAVPVFSGALGKADDAVKDANERSVKAEATTQYITATTDAERNAVNGSIYWANEKGDVTGPTTTAPSDAKYKYTVSVTGVDGDNPVIAVVQSDVSASSGGDTPTE